MFKLLTLAFAGAAGTISRYLLGGWVHQWFGPKFPFGTMLCYILGCFIIGLLGTWSDEKSLLNPNTRAALLIGFLGAFTTFSSFTYETWTLIKDSQYFFAGLNIVLSLCCCFIGLFLGVILARLVP